MTLNTILKEMKSLPANRLDELYQFVHSLNTGANPTDSLRKKILSFSGAFEDMSDKDYAEFIEQTKKTRASLFTRNIRK